jgi:hypothetical protein
MVQSSPLAGFQYYAGKILWDEMRGRPPGPDPRARQPHDAHAVRVEWRGTKLGYLPRATTGRWPRRWTRARRWRPHRPPGRTRTPGSACGRRAGGFVSGFRPGGHSGPNARIAALFRSS